MEKNSAQAQNVRCTPARFTIFTFLLFLSPLSIVAQTVTTTIAVGTSPGSVAVNPVTNKTYVVNSGSNNVTAIDGATNSTTTISVGTTPCGIAVNPLTNKIYVANGASNNVTVIDGATNSTTNVAVGTSPCALAVNPATNKIYVANNGSNNVTVIDGVFNSTTTVAAGINPNSVAVNVTTNVIYVTNLNSSNVTVINGLNNSTATVPCTGIFPVAVAVNAVTNKIYVADAGSELGGDIMVINGANNSTVSVADGGDALDVAVNPVTNKIYVTNQLTNNVTVVDGFTNSTTLVSTGSDPFAVAVNVVTDQIYVTNALSNSVTVINGSNNSTTTVQDLKAGEPIAVAVNPVTDKIYVANGTSKNVSVIDGATNATASIATGARPAAVATNPVTDNIYVANNASSDITVINGVNNLTTTVNAGTNPTAVAVNPLTNRIYVANNGSNNVTVIDGATNSTTTVTDPSASGPSAVAVNVVTNKIYVANSNSKNLTVIDGNTNSTTTIATPGTFGPVAVAVNPVTNKIYATNLASTIVIDGTTNSATTVTDPSANGAFAIGVNDVTNKIYVANISSKNVTVIDGATNSIATVAVGTTPRDVAVNPVTNKIYVVTNSFNFVTIIDGATNTTSDVLTGNSPFAATVNPTTNKIYVTNSGSNNVTVIDGATNATATVAAGAEPESLSVNPMTNKVYIANVNGADVTAISEQQVQAIPLEASITAIPGNESGTPTPTFDFNATTLFNPAAPPPDNLLFQVDTWQGAWSKAANQGGNLFSGTTAALLAGFHILYSYSTDGQDATSTNTVHQSSPLISNIVAYGFLVSEPKIASLSPSSGPIGASVKIRGIGFGQSQDGATVTFGGDNAGIATSWADNQIVINVPFGADAHGSSVAVVVTKDGIASNSMIFTITPQANLSITKSASPSPVTINNNLTYSIHVGNSGSIVTGAVMKDTLPAGTTFVSVAAIPGPATTVSCSQAAGVVTCSLNMPGSGGGAIIRILVTPTKAGTITNTATVSSSLPDPNPANNTASVSTTVVGTGADLVETSVSNPPGSTTLGVSFAVTDTSRNAGTVTAGASLTRYYLSTTTSKTSASILLTGSRSVGILAPGASSTGTVSVTVPSMPAGSYFLLACANDTRTAIEINYSNNCIASVTKVNVTAADLVETVVSNPPAGLTLGNTFAVSDATRNQGNATAGPSVTRYYLSTTGAKTSTSTLLTGTRSVPGLLPGASSSGSINVTVPSMLSGTYFLLACANDTHTVLESNFGNNCIASAATVKVTAPDLIEAGINVTISRFGFFLVSDTALNQGNATAGPSVTRYYLSATPNKSASSILLNGSRSVPTLPPGTASTGRASAAPRSSLPPGKYFFLGCVNDMRTVLESNFTNNCKASSQTIVIP